MSEIETQLHLTSFATLTDQLERNNRPTLVARSSTDVPKGSAHIGEDGVVVNPNDATRLNDIAGATGWNVSWVDR